MSRQNQRRTRLNQAATISFNQAKVIFSLHWRTALLGALVFSSLSACLSFFDAPQFQSVAIMKVRVFDLARAVGNNALLKDTDAVGAKELVDQKFKQINTSDFAEELEIAVKKNPSATPLALVWKIGLRLRVRFMLQHLGFASVQYPKIDLSTLNSSELVALFMGMSNLESDYSDNTIRIQVTGIDPFATAYVANIMAKALVATSRRIEMNEISNSINFLAAQKESTRKKLFEAEQNINSFYKENPSFASATAKESVVAQGSQLKEEYLKKQEEIKSNERLLEFYKKKFKAFAGNSENTTEVYEKFKQDLVELKYKKKKYLFQGYAETDEGIQELNEKIQKTEKLLETAGDFGEKQIVSMGHDAQLSEKILELQDQIKKEQIDLGLLEKRSKDAETKNKVMPEQEMLYEDFHREVRLSRELFEDISKKLDFATIRKASAEGAISLQLRAGMVGRRLETSGTKKYLFSWVIGFMLSLSGFVIVALVKKKIIDIQSVENIGLKFAGDLGVGNANRAEILTNLGCLFKNRNLNEEAPIILCCSPKASAGISQVLLLTEYLAKQKERSLFVIMGKIDVSDHFQLRSDLGYAKVYCASDDKQFILQISDEETLLSVKECLKILEGHYKVKYSMIFLYMLDGTEGLSYPLGQQLADKMLLIGPAAKHSSQEYFNLVQGFKDIDQVYVALSEAQRPRRLGLKVPFGRNKFEATA